ncbi:hypothetical protein, partial [Chromobacterium violaceum]
MSQKFNQDEQRGVSIGCNYSLKLLKEADLIPIEITRLEDAIDFIATTKRDSTFTFSQIEALMNAAFYMGAES